MSISSRKHTLASNPVPALARFDRTAQGTPGWWARRSNMVSGSKIANMCFLQSQDERQQYWEEVFGIRPRPPLDEEGMRRCQYGRDHEDDGIKNMLHNVPGLEVWEMGFERHAHPAHAQWFGSSPDGVAWWPEHGWGAVEVKCSTKKDKSGSTVPHTGIPYYYVGQMHAEMKCMPLPEPCRWTLFVSWSETKCKCYKLTYVENYWNPFWDLLVDFACNESTWESFRDKRDAMVSASKEVCARASALHPRGGFDTI